MRELDDGQCLADAAAVLAARQRVDPLLLRLAAQPFDAAAIDELRGWIDDVFPLAAPAFDRLLSDAMSAPTELAAWARAAAGPATKPAPAWRRRHDDPQAPGAWGNR